MKKLVAISVLFAGLAMAVSAQDGGWSNEWKVGLSATFATDMFFAAKQTKSDENTLETTRSKNSLETAVQTATYDSDTALADAEATYSNTSGKNAKGVAHFFPNNKVFAGDQRVSLNLRNSGENYDMFFDFTIDDWAKYIVNGWGGTVDAGGGTTYGQNLLSIFLVDAHMRDDYGIKGTAGIFSVGLGNWAAPGGWVDGNADWGSWLPPNGYNRFGVFDPKGYNHFDNFRSLGEWGEPFAVDVSLGDNYRFAFGYLLTGWQQALGFGVDDSRSSVNGTFLLSGSPVDMLAFDLFYAIRGKDSDTLSLPVGDGFGYNAGTGEWLNNIGAYVQIKGIENLAISLGYSGKFTVYEAGSFVPGTGIRDAKKVAIKSPLFNGVDVRVGFFGIDKIGLRFNNNISFASITGEKVENHIYKESVVYGFDGTLLNGGVTQNWFAWNSNLRASLGFIDGVGLEAAVGNTLTINGTITDQTKTDTEETAGVVTRKTTTTTLKNDKTTTNELIAVVGARYPIGNVTLGIALFLQLNSEIKDNNSTITTSYNQQPAIEGTNTDKVVKTTSKTVDNKVQFGIPITFNVSF